MLCSALCKSYNQISCEATTELEKELLTLYHFTIAFSCRVSKVAVDLLVSLETGDLLELLDPQETLDQLERMDSP